MTRLRWLKMPGTVAAAVISMSGCCSASHEIPENQAQSSRAIHLGCPEDARSACQISLEINAMRTHVDDCHSAGIKLGKDKQLLELAMEVRSGPIVYNETRSAFLLKNWALTDGDYILERQLTLATDCSTNAGAVELPIIPSMSMAAKLVILAPKPATQLRYSLANLRCYWNVPRHEGEFSSPHCECPQPIPSAPSPADVKITAVAESRADCPSFKVD